MEQDIPPKRKKILWYNAAFVTVCAGLFFFLWQAPQETTKKVPMDDIHRKFHSMGKKEAEKFCEDCHKPDGEKPLPPNHPDKYRCLFCHKRQ